MPLKSIVRITVRRSLFLRLFRAKEIELYCNLGSVKFFLGRDEVFAPLGEFPDEAVSASFGEAVLGAFCDTHALGGVFLFAAALTRVSGLLGDEYSERISGILEKLLSDTVSNVSGFLQSAKIFIPRAAIAIAVFALAGWVFAFSKKLLSIMRFRVAFMGDVTHVQSGVFTLYEHTLFPNSSSEIYEEGILSLMLRRAPVRMRGIILFPAVEGERARHSVSSSLRSFWGHCGVPLVIVAAAGAGLICVSLSERLRSYELLETALICVLAAALYSAAVRLVYIRFSGITPMKNGAAVTARHGLRLRSVVLPDNRVVCIVRRRNLFNKSLGNVEYFTRDRLRFKVRQVSLN